MSRTFNVYCDGTKEVMRIDMKTPYAPLFPPHTFYQIDVEKSKHFPMNSLSQAGKALGDIYAFSGYFSVGNADTEYLFQKIEIPLDLRSKREHIREIVMLLRQMRRALGERSYKTTYMGFLLKTTRSLVRKLEEGTEEPAVEDGRLKRILEI